MPQGALSSFFDAQYRMVELMVRTGSCRMNVIPTCSATVPRPGPRPARRARRGHSTCRDRGPRQERSRGRFRDYYQSRSGLGQEEDSQGNITMLDVTSGLIADLFQMDVEAAAGLSSATIRDPSPSVRSTSVIGIGTDRFTDQVTAGVDSLTMSGTVGSGSHATGRVVCEEEIDEEIVDYNQGRTTIFFFPFLPTIWISSV